MYEVKVVELVYGLFSNSLDRRTYVTVEIGAQKDVGAIVS